MSKKTKGDNAKITSLEDHKALTAVGYDRLKYNALKHGILSRYTVMPWENEEDYKTLLNSLIIEHTPKGITEEHLVEELAGVIWRKMRLRYAESTSLQRSLNSCIGSNFSTDSHYAAKDALLAKSDEVKGFDIREAILATEDETQIELEQAREYLNCCLKAEKILLESDCYDEGLATLPEDDRNNWQNEDGLKGSNYGSYQDRCNYVDTAESLLSWVIKAVKHYEKHIYGLENRGKIKKQILGQSFLSDSQLSTYSRYENHLDKKFGKTLGMLLKLKALRGDIELITPIN